MVDRGLVNELRGLWSTNHVPDFRINYTRSHYFFQAANNNQAYSVQEGSLIPISRPVVQGMGQSFWRDDRDSVMQRVQHNDLIEKQFVEIRRHENIIKEIQTKNRESLKEVIINYIVRVQLAKELQVSAEKALLQAQVKEAEEAVRVWVDSGAVDSKEDMKEMNQTMHSFKAEHQSQIIEMQNHFQVEMQSIKRSFREKLESYKKSLSDRRNERHNEINRVKNSSVQMQMQVREEELYKFLYDGH